MLSTDDVNEYPNGKIITLTCPRFSIQGEDMEKKIMETKDYSDFFIFFQQQIERELPKSRMQKHHDQINMKIIFLNVIIEKKENDNYSNINFIYYYLFQCECCQNYACFLLNINAANFCRVCQYPFYLAVHPRHLSLKQNQIQLNAARQNYVNYGVCLPNKLRYSSRPLIDFELDDQYIENLLYHFVPLFPWVIIQIISLYFHRFSYSYSTIKFSSS
jgi:hypothetical protein